MTQQDLPGVEVPKLSPAQRTQLGLYVQALERMQCTFKIISPDGEQFGTLELAVPPVEKKRRVRGLPTAPKGTYKAIIAPYLDVIVPGETITLRRGLDFGEELILRHIGAAMINKYGKGSVQYSTNEAGGEIHVKRVK